MPTPRWHGNDAPVADARPTASGAPTGAFWAASPQARRGRSPQRGASV